MWWLAGIIPAHAGFTMFWRRCWCLRGDHPRTRGVYSAVHPTCPLTFGSSPHTRGLRAGELGLEGEDGIIPAHAGFTRRPRRSRWRGRDHPRTRGVYDSKRPGTSSISGSSPHTRGLRAAGWWTTSVTGIIPAHAGFTPGRASPGRRTTDHPRTRGVYGRSDDGREMALGSSPHTRGLPTSASPHPPLPRIIPAHAGFTTAPTPPTASSPDHPRTRGVYDAVPLDGVPLPGSSPHTRGLRAPVA